MHDIKWIRENATAFDAGLKRRGLEPLSASLLAIDEKRRAAILKSEQAQARRNAASKEIGEAKKAKDEARAASLMAEVAELKTTMPELEAGAKAADAELANALAAIPNLPLDEVPDGVDEHGNVQHHVFGAARNYAFTPKPHDDLGNALRLMDFEAAAKLSRRAVCRFEKRSGATGARDRAVHARSAHQRARLYRNQSAAAGARRGHVRHRAIAQVRRRSVLGRSKVKLLRQHTFGDGDGLPSNLQSGVILITRSALAHPHRRSPAHQSRPRIHRRRERIADAAHGADAMLPRRSGSGRARYPWHDPAAPVHQGRTGVDHDARGEPRRARAHARLRRGSAAPARPALPGDDAVRRRHGLFVAKNLRHRGLDARAGRGRRFPGDLELLGVRRLPGAADGCALSRQRR